MANTALKILNKLERHGELSLKEIAALIPKNHGDHRDFYVFASLVSVGYVDDDYFKNDKKHPASSDKEQFLARKFFACSTADKAANSGNLSWMVLGTERALRDQPFALSGKGSLYLSECRAKRFDRIFTLSSGIVVGIVVAIIGAYTRVQLASNNYIQQPQQLHAPHSLCGSTHVDLAKPWCSKKLAIKSTLTL